MRRGLALAVFVAATVAVASPTDARDNGRYLSRAYGFSAFVPSGWRRSAARLVPKLLDPREILSLGTFPMAVGGGGNCGREPIAAIARMRTGDALVSIQEYGIDAPAPSRAGAPGALPPRRAGAQGLGLRREIRPSGERVAAGEALWSATLPFADRGRRFDALVYVRGDPAPARLGQIRSILARLRLRSGRFVG
jgi:hypothetical protein